MPIAAPFTPSRSVPFSPLLLFSSSFLSAALAALASTTPAHGTVPPYSPAGSFSVPASTSIDILPDGRLIALAGDGAISIQDAPSSSSFSLAGRVDPAIFTGPSGNFGPGLLRVNPSGTRLAIGDNAAFNRLHFVDFAALSPASTTPTSSLAVPNYEGEWSSDSTFYTSGFGASSVVSRIDAAAMTSATVITNGFNGSGGIAFSGGRIFVGDGYNLGNSGNDTGFIRAFDLAALNSAPMPVQFTTGILVADALSGQSLGFDPFGNLLVGGGDYFAGSNDTGYAAVIDNAAILAALTGGPHAPDAAELRLTPNPAHPFEIQFNPATNELLVYTTTPQVRTAYRYTIPAPASFGLLSAALILSTRRRRHV